jgi:hypothetical protein
MNTLPDENATSLPGMIDVFTTSDGQIGIDGCIPRSVARELNLSQRFPGMIFLRVGDKMVLFELHLKSAPIAEYILRVAKSAGVQTGR